MEEYSVIITPDAEKDLNELDDYISIELQVPEIALAYPVFTRLCQRIAPKGSVKSGFSAHSATWNPLC